MLYHVRIFFCDPVWIHILSVRVFFCDLVANQRLSLTSFLLSEQFSFFSSTPCCYLQLFVLMYAFYLEKPSSCLWSPSRSRVGISLSGWFFEVILLSFSSFFWFSSWSIQWVFFPFPFFSFISVHFLLISCNGLNIFFLPSAIGSIQSDRDVVLQSTRRYYQGSFSFPREYVCFFFFLWSRLFWISTCMVYYLFLMTTILSSSIYFYGFYMFWLAIEFPAGALLIFFPVYYAIAIVTYGIAVPSGLFVPCLLSGRDFSHIFFSYFVSVCV